MAVQWEELLAALTARQPWVSSIVGRDGCLGAEGCEQGAAATAPGRCPGERVASGMVASSHKPPETHSITISSPCAMHACRAQTYTDRFIALQRRGLCGAPASACDVKAVSGSRQLVSLCLTQIWVWWHWGLQAEQPERLCW